MNPYEVLGVGRHASDDEIKSAYRTLIKRYHPDVNKSQDANARVVLINAAYETLSDPQKRAQYDQSPYVVTEVYEEDPIEAYKREFKRKRWEKEQAAKERRVKREMITYRVMGAVAFPMLAFALILVLDNVLPRRVYQEPGLAGWQERIGGYRRSRGVLISYMETPHFFMQVPHELHVNYPYYDVDKPPLTIAATPIFDIARSVSYIHNDMGLRYEIGGTVHSNPAQLPWLLLISSAFVVYKNEYSMLNYALCFLPLLIFGFVLLVML